MIEETHFDCPVCNNQIRIEDMAEHILEHFKEEYDDFSLAVKKDKC